MLHSSVIISSQLILSDGFCIQTFLTCLNVILLAKYMLLWTCIQSLYTLNTGFKYSNRTYSYIDTYGYFIHTICLTYDTIIDTKVLRKPIHNMLQLCTCPRIFLFVAHQQTGHLFYPQAPNQLKILHWVHHQMT